MRSFLSLQSSNLSLNSLTIKNITFYSFRCRGSAVLRQILGKEKMNFSKKDRNEYTLFSYSFSSAHLVFFLGEKRETRLVLCPEVDTARPVEMALRKIFECEYNRCPVSPLFHPPFSFYQGPARKYNSETVSTIARLRRLPVPPTILSVM